MPQIRGRISYIVEHRGAFFARAQGQFSVIGHGEDYYWNYCD